MYEYQTDPKLSKQWKEVFDIFEKYGPYGAKDPKGYTSLSFFRRTQFNVLAFIFGPIYFCFKGMYRVALSSLVIVLGIIFFLAFIDTVLGTSIGSFWSGTASGLVYTSYANYAYYTYKVHSYRGWNPYYGMFQSVNKPQ